MNKHFCLFLLLLSFLFFQSCQKEIDYALNNPANPVGVSGNMKAKINGKQWVTKQAAAFLMNDAISITGLGSDKNHITITLQDSGVHRYTLNAYSLNVAAVLDSNLADIYAMSTNGSEDPNLAGGEVIITSINKTKKTISGTFSFKVIRDFDFEKRNITEGSFTDIPYQTSLPPSTATTDTFKVKINGTSFVPNNVYSIVAFGSLSVSATNSSATKSIGVTMPSTVTKGTYQFNSFNFDYIGIYNADADGTHAQGSTSGTLTILEHNTTKKRIRGTFSFHAENMLNTTLTSEITEGYFSVKY